MRLVTEHYVSFAGFYFSKLNFHSVLKYRVLFQILFLMLLYLAGSIHMACELWTEGVVWPTEAVVCLSATLGPHNALQ